MKRVLVQFARALRLALVLPWVVIADCVAFQALSGATDPWHNPFIILKLGAAVAITLRSIPIVAAIVTSSETVASLRSYTRIASWSLLLGSVVWAGSAMAGLQGQGSDMTSPQGMWSREMDPSRVLPPNLAQLFHQATTNIYTVNNSL